MPHTVLARTVLILGLVCRVAMPGFAEAQGVEDRCQGRTVQEWLLDLTHPPSTAEARLAIRCVQAFGPGELRILLRIAAEATIDTNGNSATGLRMPAIDALRAVGPAAIPVELEGLSDPDARVRGTAVFLVAETAKGAVAAPIVPAVAHLLTDASAEVRSRAARALAIIGPAAAEAVPALIAALADPSREVERSVTESLPGIGPAAVPQLVLALKAPDPRVRRGVLYVLRFSCPRPTAAIPALIEALTDSDPAIRLDVALALNWIGPPATLALSQLEWLRLNDPDRYVRQAAWNAIRAIEQRTGFTGPSKCPASP